MRRLVKNILSILTRREKMKLQIQIFLTIIISFLDIAFIGLILLMVSVYTGELSSAPAFLPAIFLDRNSIILVSVTFLLFGLKNLAGYLVTSSQYHFVYGVASRISGANLMNYLESDYYEYVHTDSSVSMRRISQEPIEFGHYVLNSVQQIITQGVLIVFAITGILIYNATLFLLLLFLLSPPIILTARMVKNRLGAARINAKTTGEKNLQYLHESLSAYIESNIFDKNRFFKDRYHNCQVQLNNYLADQQSIQNLPARLIEVFAILGFLLLILLNKYSAGEYAVSIVTIGVFIAATYKIIPGIVKILNSLGQIQAYDFTVEDLLAEAKQRDKKTSSDTPVIAVGFNQVAFSFADRQILSNFNLEILSGDLVGISGVSGKGKTTLLHLLLGFLEADSGDITFNNVSADKKSRQARWTRIAYVKQQALFIHDTILKNIILSDDIPDELRLNEALRISGADLLVRQAPDGLNELIREHGKNLSGGQRQRIALARALYKDFDLLILDEPFSELDEHAGSGILKEIQQMTRLKNKMVLFITHDARGLAFCNKHALLT